MGLTLDQLSQGLQVQIVNALASIAAANRALSNKETQLKPSEIDKLTRSAERAQQVLTEAKGALKSIEFVPRPPSIPADPAPAAYHSGDETLSRLLSLRAGGKHQLSWEDCASALSMAPRTLNRWRLLLAAELRAQGWGWTEIAAHPAVDLNADYLRKEAGARKLPNGLSFSEHCEALQTAQRERSLELQTERGLAAAERIHAIGQQALDVYERLQVLVGDFMDNPPASFTPRGFPVAASEIVTQTLIPFNGAPPTESKRGRITAQFATHLAALQREVLAGLGVAESVLVHHEPPQAEDTAEEHDDGSLATEAEIAARKGRAERLLAELASYEGAA